MRELTTYVLDRISDLDDEIGAFLRIDAENALCRADEVQKKIDVGELTHPLAGVPYGLKDNICAAGMPTTCASEMLRINSAEDPSSSAVNPITMPA